MEIDKLLNVEQAAEVLNVSTDFLYRNQRYKTLPFTIILNRATGDSYTHAAILACASAVICSTAAVTSGS